MSASTINLFKYCTSYPGGEHQPKLMSSPPPPTLIRYPPKVFEINKPPGELSRGYTVLTYVLIVFGLVLFGSCVVL